MMNIEVKNDGKEKHQSWEARAVFPHFTGDEKVLHISGYVSEFEIVGYGATEAEAKENVNDLLGALKAKLFGM